MTTVMDGLGLVVHDRPILCDDFLPEVVTPIRAEILGRMEQLRARSAPSLNEGGWRSDALRGWAGPAATQLLAGLGTVTRARRIDAWAMVNWGGSHHPRHLHQGAQWAGVYVVDAGDPPTPTIFELPDGVELPILPAAARLIVFPAGLYHRVPPYPGQSPRITVAFDVFR